MLTNSKSGISQDEPTRHQGLRRTASFSNIAIKEDPNEDQGDDEDDQKPNENNKTLLN